MSTVDSPEKKNNGESSEFNFEHPSILRIDVTEKLSHQYRCSNPLCTYGRFDLAYSEYHASVMGWRRIEIAEEPFALLCPDCVKEEKETPYEV